MEEISNLCQETVSNARQPKPLALQDLETNLVSGAHRYLDQGPLPRTSGVIFLLYVRV